MMESEISGVALVVARWGMKKHEPDTRNNEHDALGPHRNDDGQEDEIRSDDPSSDESARISQDHTRTSPSQGDGNPLAAQIGSRVGVMGDAGMGNEERELRLGSNPLCIRWLAHAGVPKVGLESIRVALDETRIRGCDCEIREPWQEIDCGLGGLESRSRNVAKPEWWEIRTIQRRF